MRRASRILQVADDTEAFQTLYKTAASGLTRHDRLRLLQSSRMLRDAVLSKSQRIVFTGSLHRYGSKAASTQLASLQRALRTASGEFRLVVSAGLHRYEEMGGEVQMAGSILDILQRLKPEEAAKVTELELQVRCSLYVHLYVVYRVLRRVAAVRQHSACNMSCIFIGCALPQSHVRQ